MKQILKKVMSLVLVASLVLGVANIPAYAMTIKTGTNIKAVLSSNKPYMSVSESTKKALKEKAAKETKEEKTVSAAATTKATETTKNTIVQNIITKLEEFKQKFSNNKVSETIDKTINSLKQQLIGNNTDKKEEKQTKSSNQEKIITEQNIPVIANTIKVTNVEEKTPAVNAEQVTTSKTTTEQIPVTKEAKDNEKLTEILTNFGIDAAGYTYHSFPKYDTANNAYTLISTGKNNYKLEISVEVGKGENAKEQAKQEAEKIGTVLLWGKSSREIQEVLKNAKVTVKQKEQVVGVFENTSKDVMENSIIKPVAEAATVAKEAVKKVLGVSEGTNKLESNLDQTIISQYTQAGYNAIKSFANYLGLSLQTVYDKFVQMGVTKEQMEKAASGLSSLIQRGVKFFVCSTFALSKYLGISQALVAAQQIAAEISLNLFNTNTSGNYKPTSTSAIAKVLGKNGVANSETYTAYRQDFIDGLKAGDKFILVPSCYNQSGSNVTSHAVTVVKEANGDYGVYDVLFNDGDKTIYSRAQFERFLNGESATGRTVSGITITKPVYLNSASGTIRYVFGNDMYIIGDSSKIVGSYTRNKSNESISIINDLLSRGDIPSLSRTWLEQAKVLMNNICKGNMNNNDKGLWFSDANKILNEVKEKNASISSIINATEGNYRGFTDYFDGFSSLEYILNNDEESKIIMKYGDHGLYIIDKVSEYFNLSKTTVYDQFVKNGVTKDQMKTISYTFSFLDKASWYNKGNWAENLSNIPETFSQLLEMSFTKNENSSYNQSINIINTFLNNKETGNLARTWLEQAKVLVNNTLKGSQSSYEKKVWFDKAISALKEVEKNKATSLSLTKASLNFEVFSSLQSVLQNDITYKIYNEYEKDGFDAINQIAEYFNLNEATIYEQFVKNGIKKEEMKYYILPKLQKTPLSDASWYDKKSWASNYSFIPETFSTLSQMVPVKDKDKMYKECIDTINSILKKEGLSKMAKTWVEKAKELVNNKMNSKKSDLEKYEWFNKANKMLVEIEKSNDIMSTITAVTSGTYKGTMDYFDGFKPLKDYIMDYLKSKILTEPISIDLGNSLDLPKKCSACIKIVDNLLYDDDVSQEAKTWLEETKNLIIEVFNSEKTTDEKKIWFNNTYSILNGIKKNKASISYINTINLAA